MTLYKIETFVVLLYGLFVTVYADETGHVIFSDERVKSNIEKVNSADALDQIVNLEICTFDYEYDQFYNPLFGKRNVGLIAQQVEKVLPKAVGVVKKRKIPTGNGKFVEMENLHVLNQDALYMTHLGATQELAKQTRELSKTIESVQSEFQTVSSDYTQVTQQVDLAMKSVKEKQEQVELVANAAHSKADLAMTEVQATKTDLQKQILSLQVKDESLETSIQKIQDGKQAELESLSETINRKLKLAESNLRTELEAGVSMAQHTEKKLNDTISQLEQVYNTTNTVSSAYRELGQSFEKLQDHVNAKFKDHGESINKLNPRVKQLGEQFDSLEVEQKRLQNAVDDTKLLFSQSEKNHESNMKNLKADFTSSIDKVQGSVESLRADSVAQQAVASSKAEGVAKQLQVLESALEDYKEATFAEIHEKVSIGLTAAQNHTTQSVELSSRMLESTVDTHVDGLKDVDQKLWEANEALREAIAELEIEVRKQAAAEVIERRKILEAEVELQKAKVEQVHAEGEERRKTAEFLTQQEIEKEKRFNETTVKRVAFEESAKLERELEIISAQEDSQKRLRDYGTQAEIEVENVKSKNEIKRIETERETRLAEIKLEKEAEAIQERQNKDVRQELALLQAEEDRKKLVEAIRVGFQEAINSVVWLSESPVIVMGSAITLVAVLGAVYAARELAILFRRRMEQLIGRPSLLRESSQKSIFWTYFSVLKWAKQLLGFVYNQLVIPLLFQSTSDHPYKPKSFKGGWDMSDVFSDVVLSPETFQQIKRISVSTSTAHSRGSPLRHVLFYGPPGTGKTMVAKRMAKLSGLDYAIMSGADVAPLQEQAVTEIHALFRWAKSTPKGVLLFIDEADAFLCSRNSANLSESSRNALTALLYHTGSASSKVMLVLATNRPRDIDSAVLDRVDESVQFSKPGLDERVNLVKHYYAQEISSHSLAQYLQERSQLALKPWYIRMVRKMLQGSKVHVGSLIKVENVTNDSLVTVAKMLDGFSGREIAKLFVTLQAHAFGSIQRVDESKAAKSTHGWRSPRSGQHLQGPFLNHATLLGVVKEVVARHNAVNTYAKEV